MGNYSLYKNLIKTEMLNNEAGSQMYKGDIVELALGKLAIIDDVVINDNIEKYISKKDEILKKIEDNNKELTDLVDSVYEQLMKDL